MDFPNSLYLLIHKDCQVNNLRQTQETILHFFLFLKKEDFYVVFFLYAPFLLQEVLLSSDMVNLFEVVSGVFVRC